MISQPLKPPAPAEIRAAREYASLTQSQAAELVHSRNYNTWANWEAERADPRHREIPLATWELFLVKTNQRSIDRRELALVRGELIACRRCHVISRREDLVDAEACPNCKLVDPGAPPAAALEILRQPARAAGERKRRSAGLHRSDRRRPR